MPMPFSSSQSWRSASDLFAESARCGHVVLERGAPGRRPGWRAATPMPAMTREESEVHRAHRHAARHAPALEQLDQRVEDQRDDRRDDEDQQHRAGRRASAQSPSSPAAAPRAGSTRGTTTGSTPGASSGWSGSSGCVRLHRRRRISHKAPPPARVPRLTMRLLFVGDIVGGDRQAHRCLPCFRSCASATRPTSSSSTARTPPAGSASRPKIADELFAAGVDVDHARQPHLPPPRGLPLPRRAATRILRPANFLKGQPGHGTLRRRAQRRCGSGWSTCRATSS